jgi:hypothetical protein
LINLGIDNLNPQIPDRIEYAAQESIPVVPKAALKHYWSAVLDDLKINSKESHDLWLLYGKPVTVLFMSLCGLLNIVTNSIAIRDAIKTY